MAHKQPKTSIIEEELELFMEELFRLKEDYEKCDNEFLKQELQADLGVLLSAIDKMKRL